MAGRRKQAGSVGVTREQYQEQQAAKKEQQAREVPSAYGEQYGGKIDLQPERYPNAISHDTAFHDRLFEHISNLRARVDGALQSGKVKQVASRVKPHLDMAESELQRSFAAHKAGSEHGVQAFHTADAAYVKANQHLSNAHRELINGLGMGGQLKRIAGDNSELPLLTHVQREELTKNYTNHVRTAALNKKVALPEGVAADRKLDLSDIGQVTPVGRATRYTRVPSAPRVSTAARRLTDTAMRGGAVPTRAEVEYAAAMEAEGKPIPKKKANPYAGVGITGFSTVANAAKIHYEFHNPGKKWSQSQESRDPVGYAAKHKVGLPNQEATIKMAVNRLGLGETFESKGDKRTSAEATPIRQLIKNKFTEEPESAQPAAPKRNRNKDFTQGGTK